MRTLKFGVFLTACVAAVTVLSGCTVVYSPQPAPTIQPSVQSKPGGSSTGANDQLASWTDYSTDSYLKGIADTIGMGALYNANTVLRRTDDTGYSFVGTYGVSCIVALGFDAKYANTRLNQIPEMNVTILSRYNPVIYWYHQADVKDSDVKSLLARHVDDCR